MYVCKCTRTRAAFMCVRRSFRRGNGAARWGAYSGGLFLLGLCPSKGLRTAVAECSPQGWPPLAPTCRLSVPPAAVPRPPWPLQSATTSVEYKGGRLPISLLLPKGCHFCTGIDFAATSWLRRRCGTILARGGPVGYVQVAKPQFAEYGEPGTTAACLLWWHQLAGALHAVRRYSVGGAVVRRRITRSRWLRRGWFPMALFGAPPLDVASDGKRGPVAMSHLADGVAELRP